MTGNSWPSWRRADAVQLLRYVQTGALATVLPPEARPPGRSGAPPEVRLRQVFAAFAAAGVRYADEDPGASGEQDVRPPDQVFVRPGRANCLDLAVAFAGGCLDAGLHPIVVTLTPAAGPARHAVVVVWLRGDLGAASYPLSEVVHPAAPDWPGMGLRTAWDEPGEFVAVDIARVAQGWPNRDTPPEFTDAVAAAATMLTGRAWRWDVGVDVGLGRDAVEPHVLPRRPDVAPLEEPYHPDARADIGSPLESVRARNRIVPFEPRGALDTLQDWCLAPDDTQPRLRLALVHGVGGAGKTRLAAELAHQLVEEEGWHAGFLRRELTRSGAAHEDLVWLAGVIGPVLVIVDYVEQTDPATLAEQLKILTARRGRTAVLLTARSPGDWRRSLDAELGSRGVAPDSFPDTRLDALHPNAEVVYRRAYRRFSPVTGAADVAPDLPAVSARWTTLDVVMAGWLMARMPGAGLPADRIALYERILDREFVNWNAYLKENVGRTADETALRRAAAVVSLLSPLPETATAALKAAEITDLTSLAPGEIAALLRRFLTDADEGVLALRPDPLADHLLVTEFAPDALFDRCVDLVAGSAADDPDWAAVNRLVDNLTRAADRGPDVTGRLADRILGRHPRLWPAALAAAWTRGGPFVPSLEDLAGRDDTPLPVERLAEDVPSGHGSLRTLALRAAEQATRRAPAGTRDDDSRERMAGALNNLAVRQGEAGDRAGALASITEAVDHYRQLAAANPATFLPNLAGSLNNLSNRQSNTGDRTGGLTSSTEAVDHYRQLAAANPAAFLPDLAMSLNNLSNQQGATGDRAGALASITEAVAHHRALAAANPAAYLPDLATSLNNLSVQQSHTGDRAGALASITEAVAIRRELAAANPAAYLPDLATSLNNLSVQQSHTGDRDGALASITEAVAIRRELATANPAAFLPDLAGSLNNLSNQQSHTGDRAGALASSTEAVAICRELGAGNPAAFLPDLAMSLNNLSLQRSNTGDRGGALASITEAVDHHRALAVANPAAYLPDLAMSLSNLSVQQSHTGDRGGALASITEAVDHHRALAVANPAAYLPDLATSLNNLSNQQSHTGDRDGALASITEAVDHHRALAVANPAAYLPNLAMSLNNLSNQQGATGDRAGALASITEAVDHHRQLAVANPAAYLPDLATSLNNLSVQQSHTGDRDGALASITEAVDHHRQLAVANPAAYLPNLATSLNNLSVQQSHTGDRDGALASITEAVDHHRQLAVANPAAYLPDLATSLNNLSNQQSDTGDRDGALASITEAVDHHRALAAANPAAFLPDLAGSLSNLSNQQGATGDRAGALASITEALAIRRQLAAANPAAFLPDLATSLSNLSNQQGATGDRTGALASITEALAIRRQLAAANPAAFLPDLATSLNNLSNQQSHTGDRAGALASITEAITIRRELAAINPATFLPDLAASLQARADLLAADDGIHIAVSAWDDAVEQLPAASRSRLLAYRSEWHQLHGRDDDARTDLRRAAHLIDDIDGDDAGSDLSQVSLARQHVRAQLADDGVPQRPDPRLPTWVTQPIPDELVELANTWMSSGWPERRRILTDTDQPVDRDALGALAAVYCDRPALGQWLDLLAAADRDGMDAVVAEMDAAQATMDLITAWITTPSWNASQAFLAAHPDLHGRDVRAALEGLSGDPSARQHLAILRLVDHTPAGDVFDAILDPSDARNLLLAVARRGSVDDIAEAWLAVPALADDPFTAPLAVALALILGDDPDSQLDEIDQAATALAAAASTRDRRDVLTLLGTLTRIRDDRAAPLNRIADALRTSPRPQGQKS